MAERVVDPLEVVEIDVGERHRRPRQPRLGHGLGQRSVHRGPIREAGQGVVVGEVLDPIGDAHPRTNRPRSRKLYGRTTAGESAAGSHSRGAPLPSALTTQVVSPSR